MSYSITVNIMWFIDNNTLKKPFLFSFFLKTSHMKKRSLGYLRKFERYISLLAF